MPSMVPKRTLIFVSNKHEIKPNNFQDFEYRIEYNFMIFGYLFA